MRPFRAARRHRCPVLDLLAPPRCLGCGARAPLPFCSGCFEAIRVLPAGCRRCAAPPGAGHACWPPDAPIDATVAVFDYRGPLASAVVTAKLHGARAGWPLLGESLAARVVSSPLEADVVTWITTPASRVRERGVDHARALAEVVARGAGLPCVQLLDARVASRPNGWARQPEHDVYRAVGSLPGTHVLMVDDVVTTGSTAWRAAACLRAAGADRIELAVLARAGSHALGATRTSRGVGRSRPG